MGWEGNRTLAFPLDQMSGNVYASAWDLMDLHF
jgi:hypothetical protein